MCGWELKCASWPKIEMGQIWWDGLKRKVEQISWDRGSSKLSKV